jgi:hypothetical protein
MAIAFDASSIGTITAGSSSVNISHTCTGSDLILHVFVTQQNDASATRITGITYSGAALTKVRTYTNASGDTTYAWELVNPATGTNTLAVTRSLTTNTALINALSHTGAKQSSQPDNSASANTSGLTLTATLTTAADNCWTLLGVYDSDGGTASASTGSTQRASAATYSRAFDSNGPKTPAGSASMAVTRATGSSPFSGVIVSIAPKVASAANAGFLQLM